MSGLMEILTRLHSDVDYDTCETLIDDGILDSFDIITIVTDLSTNEDVRIPVEEIVPENFNSARALQALVDRLKAEM